VIRRTWAVSWLSLALAACASVPAPVTRSPQSPAHPAAPEAVTPPAVPILMSGDEAEPPVPAPPAEAHPGHGAPSTPAAPGSEAEAYACPMHPEVTADVPGTCRVCGMALVERGEEGSR